MCISRHHHNTDAQWQHRTLVPTANMHALYIYKCHTQRCTSSYTETLCCRGIKSLYRLIHKYISRDLYHYHYYYHCTSKLPYIPYMNWYSSWKWRTKNQSWLDDFATLPLNALVMVLPLPLHWTISLYTTALSFTTIYTLYIPQIPFRSVLLCVIVIIGIAIRFEVKCVYMPFAYTHIYTLHIYPLFSCEITFTQKHMNTQTHTYMRTFVYITLHPSTTWIQQ